MNETGKNLALMQTPWARRLCMLCFLLAFFCSGLLRGALSASPGPWELEEEEEIETTSTDSESSDPLDFSIDSEWLTDWDLDFTTSGFDFDQQGEELEPMSEEELLQVLAKQEETDFLVIPEDSGIADMDIFTLLLIGSDAYDEESLGRADTTLLVQINAEKKTIKMVSFLRDMYVQIPGRSSNRLNAAYAWGGERLLRRTLRNVFGVEADAYMEVNFARLIRLIDAIGGVEITLSEEEQRQVNSILRFYNTYTGDREEDQLLYAYGENILLTGKQALCYARIRKIDNDFARTQRQRNVIEAAFHRVMELSLADMTKIVTENLDAVRTDLSLGDVIRLIPMAIRCQDAAFSTLAIPVAGSYHTETISGMSVISVNIRQNRSRLRTFLAVD
mgnify:CR=1